MPRRKKVTSLRYLGSIALASSALACAHRSPPPREDSRAAAPALPEDAGTHSPDAGVAAPPVGRHTPTSLDAATPLQREFAPRTDVVGQSMQQHDNPRALAEARCQQQERCGFVRQGGRYILREQCLAVVLEEQRAALVEYSCTRNTDPGALQRCLQAVITMDCAQPFSSFEAIPECSHVRVCRGTNLALPAPSGDHSTR